MIEAKRELRARMIAAREEWGGDAAAAAVSVRDRFLDAFADRLGPRPVVSAYWPMGCELDVRPLMRALDAKGCALALPVVAARGEPLVFRRWRPGEALVAAAFGLSEPSAEAPVVRPEIAVVPLLAADLAGHRLGYGGGYYDRTIRGLRAAGRLLAVGVCYDLQLIASVPAGERDEPLDWIVTERRAVRCDGPGGG